MFFKNAFNHARDMFRKAPEVANNMFVKAREIATNISRGAGDTSRILGEVGGVAQQILDSRTAREIMGMHPELRRAGGLAQRGINGVNIASGLSAQLSDLSNERSYNAGNHDDNLINAIERGRNIRRDANALHYV